MDAFLQQSEASFGDWHAQPDRLRTITQRGRASRITPCPLFGGNLSSPARGARAAKSDLRQRVATFKTGRVTRTLGITVVSQRLMGRPRAALSDRRGRSSETFALRGGLQSGAAAEAPKRPQRCQRKSRRNRC